MFAFSKPIDVEGPCPEYTVVSGFNFFINLINDLSRIFLSPPGKSVLPIEPWNNVSPTKIASLIRKLQPPGV